MASHRDLREVDGYNTISIVDTPVATGCSSGLIDSGVAHCWSGHAWAWRDPEKVPVC